RIYMQEGEKLRWNVNGYLNDWGRDMLETIRNQGERLNNLIKLTFHSQARGVRQHQNHLKKYIE
ncbi:MAG TPA: hypothetical protein O0X32_02505, partial [Methanocorpusculum sp.]|nr:hypothetical protein [Methanocorpusculum sp.]